MKQLDQSISAAENNSNSMAVKDSSEQLTESARYYPNVTGGMGTDSPAETSRPKTDSNFIQKPADMATHNEPGQCYNNVTSKYVTGLCSSSDSPTTGNDVSIHTKCVLKKNIDYNLTLFPIVHPRYHTILLEEQLQKN